MCSAGTGECVFMGEQEVASSHQQRRQCSLHLEEQGEFCCRVYKLACSMRLYFFCSMFILYYGYIIQTKINIINKLTGGQLSDFAWQ